LSDSPRNGGIQAVARATEVLRLVCERGAVNAQEVGSLTGLDRTTAHRYLDTLLKVGFLSRVNDGNQRGGYRLGPFASMISSAVLTGQNANAATEEALQGIADAVGHTAVMSVVTGRDVVVAKVAHPTAERLSIRIAVGYRVPPTGIQALVALAFESPAAIDDGLEQIPRADRAQTRQLLEEIRAGGGLVQSTTEGVELVAVPIFQDGVVTATLASLAFAGEAEDSGEVLAYLVGRSRELSRPAIS
jgi:DNA-binding IclR family transcriptional regulator